METWNLKWTKLVSLSESSIEQLPDNTAGVYRLSYKAKDGDFYVFYVGQAKDIKTRLQEHLSSNEKNHCISLYIGKDNCYFRYATITEEYVRDAAELQMYNHYQPSCNELEPEGREDIKINLN